MIARLCMLFALLASVVVQYVIPGAPLYQFGWYNVLIAALFVIALMQSRFRKAPSLPLDSVAMILTRLGLALVALAGIANGLLAPAPATNIASPGTALPVPALHGTVNFPLILSGVALSHGTLSASTADSGIQPVLVRGRENMQLCAGRAQIISSFEVWCVPRDVIAVQAFDANGARLTVTQPAGSAFLSPVLLLVGRQTIANMSLPYDTFAIPAVHRIVNVVFFDARHAAMLRTTPVDQLAILYAVNDETSRPLPNAIRMAQNGERVTVGDVQLIGTASRYPALRIVPIPMPLAVIAGLIAIALGMLLHIQSRRLQAGKHETRGNAI